MWIVLADAGFTVALVYTAFSSGFDPQPELQVAPLMPAAWPFEIPFERRAKQGGATFSACWWDSGKGRQSRHYHSTIKRASNPPCACFFFFLFNKTPRPRRQALWFIHLRLKEHRYREEISPTPISRSSSLEARNPFRLKPNREDHCASSWTSQFSHWIQWSSLVGWVITRMSVIKVSWYVRVFLLVRWISWASSFISNDRFVLWFTHFNSGFCFTE